VHAATLRRLIVFGVCAAGVTCLYLAGGGARAPHQAGGPRPAGPAPDPSASTLTQVPASTTSATLWTPAPTRTVSSPLEPVQTTPAATPPGRPSGRTSTALDPSSREDGVAPAPVSALISGGATPDLLTVRWPAATDNVGVVAYRVLLNGYPVASNPATHATVRWFNDDASEHVIQVRALDAAGNVSPASPSLVVARPTPSPTPTGTPTPAPSASPTPTPAPSLSAEPHSTASPTAPQWAPGDPATEPSQDSTPRSTPSPGEEPLITPSQQPTPSLQLTPSGGTR
jgi:hypothetical protein